MDKIREQRRFVKELLKPIIQRISPFFFLLKFRFVGKLAQMATILKMAYANFVIFLALNVQVLQVHNV